MKSPAIFACAVALYVASSSAFVVVTPGRSFLRSATSSAPRCQRSSSCSSSSASGGSSRAAMLMTQDKPALDRGNFLSNAGEAFFLGAAGLGLGVSSVSAAGEASGQLGDLDGGAPTPMGTVKITEGAELSEDAARVQRKLAAQAKVTGKTSSGQMTYSESRAAEDEKQAKMKAERNDKARRRAAMCEELGRGC